MKTVDAVGALTDLSQLELTMWNIVLFYYSITTYKST